MITKHIIVEIQIDDKVAELYPDYDIFFEDINDFTNLGYSVRVMEAHDFDHLITFSKN